MQPPARRAAGCQHVRPWSPTSRRAIALLALGAIAACGEGPDAAATAFAQATAAGDVVRLRQLVSPADSAILANPRDSTAAWWLRSAAAPRHGWALDSTRLLRATDDTARVVVFWMAPNWSGIEYSTQEARKADADFVSKLPRITQLDTLVLVPVGGALSRQWRVSMDLPFHALVGPHRLTAASWQASPADRRAALARVRAIYDSTGRDPGSGWTGFFAEIEHGLVWTDSVSYTLRIVNAPPRLYGVSPHSREVEGTLVNRSSRPIARAEIRFRMTSGETGEATTFDIPPGGREELIGFGNWNGELASHYVSEVVPAP